MLSAVLRLDEHTGYLLRLAYDHAHSAAEAEFPDGPHPRIYALLTALIGMGPMSQQELAERLRINRTLLVGIVDDLERRGWVERRRDPADRRSYTVSMIAEGKRVLARAREIATTLDPGDTELAALLRKLIGLADPRG